MGKRSWFNLMKRLFIWDRQSIQEKKKRRKWVSCRLMLKRLTPITATQKETTPSGEAEEEQRKHALTVKEKSAAIKIQSAFRGYLARKALRALKGIVKLQAIIRGRAVRRQAISTLKCLQSIVNIQSQVCARRLQMAEGRSDCDRNHDKQGSRDKIIRIDSSCKNRWNDSILLKEEIDTSCINKKEAALRRERMKQYSFNHRMSAETERKRVNGRWRYWLDQWVDTQLSKSKELEDLDSVFSSHYRGSEENGGRSLLLRNIQRKNPIEGLNCHRRQCSMGGGEDRSFPSSPVIPTYMAVTESAKAKARSTSSPRVRTWNLENNYSDHSYSPCKKVIPLVSSVNNSSEVLSGGRMGKLSGSNYQQRSPSLKGLSSMASKVL